MKRQIFFLKPSIREENFMFSDLVSSFLIESQGFKTW